MVDLGPDGPEPGPAPPGAAHANVQADAQADRGSVGAMITYAAVAFAAVALPMSFLVPGLELVIRDERGDEATEEHFKHDGGISEFCDFLATDQKVTDVVRLTGTGHFTETVPMLDDAGHMTPTDVERDLEVDIAVRWGDGYETEVRSFVNIVATPKGGTHVAGFERALAKTFTSVLDGTRLLKSGEEIIKDDVLEGLTSVVTVRLAEPQFDGQTKEVLGTPAASRIVAKVVQNELEAFLTSNKREHKAQARAVLGKLTDQNLSSATFPYLTCVQNEVAGVPTLLLRIGFVGESGWEMHFPAEYGEHVWDALMEAGKEFGIAPFGVETQRILRLEKKHLIVGQDTDALSNPLEADVAWVVKFDKADFVGKKALMSVQQRGLRQKLVGFVMRDTIVAEEGNAVVVDGKPVGRVASSRLSPSMGKCVGLAWVPVEIVADGTPLHIRVNGAVGVADIVSHPFYDPEGKRLRS